MVDRPQTPEEKAVRMYEKPAWISKWYFRRKRAREDVADTISGELHRAVREWIGEKKNRVRGYVTQLSMDD